MQKLLDPVWPKCIQSVAVGATLVEESRKLTFSGAIITSTPHQVGNILNQKVEQWLLTPGS
jgi:hypothetical protein